MYIQWLLLIIVIYSSAAILLFILNRTAYASILPALRKSLYLGFLLFLAVCFSLDLLSSKDWPVILQLTAAAVFTDLTIFQTPNLLKIGTAEFKHSEWIEQTIQQNERTIEYMRKKSTAFSLIIQEEEDLAPKDCSYQDFEAYKRCILQYTGAYTDQFDFHVRLYPLEGEDDYRFSSSILHAMNKLETIFNLNIPDKQETVEQLKQARVQTFEEHAVAAIPIYGIYSCLLVVSAKENPVLEIDTHHIINLVSILEWRMQMEKGAAAGDEQPGADGGIV
ncbi:hypothetical protein GKZ89_06425 [Bacillus mangrovi]|uniref:Uncharacterized protein n=1 Tax=Metabacillus mangrovi TaxID=1491830 RepID=A0A7X2S3N0_9BACI|nr:type II toxin-antitoxin system SpoIISA family toxin [Metabacillus mangrovi]MTH53042.1 hypothetical protein [Metabacillus mangrovi]